MSEFFYMFDNIYIGLLLYNFSYSVINHIFVTKTQKYTVMKQATLCTYISALDKDAEVPFRVLILNYYHHTMDMSVANHSQRSRMIIIRKDAKFPIESENWCECGKTTIQGIDESGNIKLKWLGYEYTLSPGEEKDTATVYLDNPYLSHEEVSMGYEYCDGIDAIDVVLAYCEDVRKQQEKRPVVNSDIEDDKEKALQSLWYVIDDMGFVGFYPFYALMKSCKNWASFTITDWDEFAKIMQEAIKTDCFASQNSYAAYNLVEVLKFNPSDKVYKKVPTLKEALIKMAEGGSEEAQYILEEGIEYIEKTSREDSELKHLTLTIEGEVDEWIERFYYQLVGAQITANRTIDMGEYGEARICEVGDDWVDFVWQNESYRLKDNFYRVELPPVKLDDGREIDFTVRFYKQNLWSLLKNSISIVEFDQVSTNFSKKGCIAEKKAAAIRLVEMLIKQGDDDLQNLCDTMKSQEDWTCFGYDGELHCLLE